MRLLLRVLCLSGWLLLSSGLVRHYILSSSLQTWAQAQTYCRQTYADLATYENAEDVQLMAHFLTAANLSDVWIGLMCDYADLWSPSIDGSAALWENRTRTDPLSAYHFCGSISQAGFGYEHWSVRNPFICSNGTGLVFVNETVDWFGARTRCRELSSDLTAPPGPTWNASQDGPWYPGVLSLVPSGYRAWTGLYKLPVVSWSDGSNVSFGYWDDAQPPSAWLPRMYGVANFNRSQRWRLLPDGGTLPFICLNYTEDVTNAPVAETEQKNKKVLRLRMSSSLDVSSPTVEPVILAQLQDRLKDKGVSGVTLSWRKQPDGKVFHKEREADVAHDEC